MLLVFYKTNIKTIEFYLMHFGFALDLPDTDLSNIDLLDTHLVLLDTDIHNKYFVCLQNVLQTSSRHVFKTSWRHLQRSNFSSFKTSPRLLQDVFKRYLQDVFETFSRRPGRKAKNCYDEDVLKTSSRHVLKQSSRRLKDQQVFAGLGSNIGSVLS